MTVNERPGVYTSYVVSESRYSLPNAGIAGVAAEGDGDDDIVHSVTSLAYAEETFGADADITKLIKILFESGVYEVKAVPLSDGTAASYTAAFALLAADESVRILVSGSNLPAVASALKTAILSADVRAAHKIGVFECSAETASGYVSAAEAINCERMVLVSPAALDYEGNAAAVGSLAASVAGAILTTTDPAVPLNGARLCGIGGVTQRFTDGEINTLVRGGVTPTESVGGDTTIVRGITTRSKSGDTPDATWREINTVLIVDDVIPTVRDALKNSFLRAKNTAQTREAIKTRVMIELRKKVNAEIIESFDNITAVPAPDDPTTCLVTFDFTVVHGINHICLTAYITI